MQMINGNVCNIKMLMKVLIALLVFIILVIISVLGGAYNDEHRKYTRSTAEKYRREESIDSIYKDMDIYDILDYNTTWKRVSIIELLHGNLGCEAHNKLERNTIKAELHNVTVSSHITEGITYYSIDKFELPAEKCTKEEIITLDILATKGASVDCLLLYDKTSEQNYVLDRFQVLNIKEVGVVN